MNWSQRQKEIMDQAVLLIAERGIQGLTVRSLAGRLGVTEPAIYRHFENKAGVLMGLLSRFEDASLARLSKFADGDACCLDLVENFILSSFTDFATHPEVTAIIFAEEIFHNDSHLSQKVVEIMQRHQEALLGLFRTGQRKGSIRADVPADQLVLLVQGALRLLVSRWRICGYQFDLVEAGRELSSTLRKMLT